MKIKSPAINPAWFRAQLARSGVPQATVAARLGIDRSAVHRMTHGARAPRVHEIPILAELLGVTVDEVMAQTGAGPGRPGSSGTPRATGHAQVSVVGSIAHTLEVTWRVPPGPPSVPSPAPHDGRLVALRYLTAGTSLEVLDGALVFVHRPAGADTDAPPDGSGPLDVGGSIGRLALVRFEPQTRGQPAVRSSRKPGRPRSGSPHTSSTIPSARWALRVLRRGHWVGVWQLASLDGGTVLESEAVVTVATPVLWMQLG